MARFLLAALSEFDMHCLIGENAPTGPWVNGACKVRIVGNLKKQLLGTAALEPGCGISTTTNMARTWQILDEHTDQDGWECVIASLVAQVERMR